MLEKIYCHTKPERWDIKSTYCEVGNWYYHHRYRAATSEDEVERMKLKLSHFDIKLEDDRSSRTMLCLNLSDMDQFFWTREEYREKILDKVLD